MRIDAEKCMGCLECIDFCPVDCIVEEDGGARIDEDECVECGVCLRAGVCPNDALFMPEESLRYPRLVRFRRGEFGMALEFGRPGIGARLTEIEKVLQALMTMQVELEENNPVFGLVADMKTGTLKPEVRNEKVLSAILEFKIRQERLEEIVRRLTPVLAEVDTVVSWGLATRFAEDGSLPVLSRLDALGVPARPNGKVNMGMGRPIVEP
jgi:NAD-dependent dihydropyrimidine dehydrogenase PreA subunit